MNKKILIMLFTLCLTVMTVSILPIHGEEKIYDSVVRLHVIANSDSNSDQELKLAVRDAILEKSADGFAVCATREEAIAAIESELDAIRRTAKEVVESFGYNYDVSVALGTEEYPTKAYEGFAFPSGSYLSLRVMIGEAAGENWWCVLFPPLCLDAATESNINDAFISVGLTPEEYKIITETDNPKYQVRFKILETFDKIFD